MNVFFMLINHRWKRVEPLAGRDIMYLETISRYSWKTVRADRRFPSNGASRDRLGHPGESNSYVGGASL